MHKKTLITCCVFFSTLANAQQKDIATKSKFSFHPIIQMGLLEGEGSSAFQLLAINGVAYKTWFGGIGIGLDHYNIRTVPLFASVRKDILNKPSTPFVYGDVGTQFVWLREKDKYQYGNQDFRAGIYYNVGAGYKLSVAKRNALFFNGGYSLKKFSYQRNYAYECLVAPCPEYYNSTEYI